MEIALKVDVDTHRGLGEGVPRLAAMLREKGVTASFFIAMGPDNSGKAAMRALRNPGFLSKMRRTQRGRNVWIAHCAFRYAPAVAADRAGVSASGARFGG